MIHADLLGERARLTPGKTALVMVPGGERYSYGELDERARRCAAFWRQHCGLAKGDRVGILAHNRVEYIDAFFGAAKSGVVLVTMCTRLTAAELEHIVSDSGMRVIMYDGAFAEVIEELKQRVSVEHWIPLDTQYRELAGSVSLESWSREPCGPEDTHCLLYTSGTTGRPKGVMVPHRMVAWNGYNTVACWRLRADDVSPIFTPLYHAGGLMAFLTPLFTIGGTIVLHTGFDPGEIWRTIEAERCSVVLGVPTIWKMLMDAPEFEKVDLFHVRWFISGGAPLPLYIIEAFQKRGVVFKQGFGMTEVGVNCFSMSVQDSYDKAGSIGRPMAFTEVRLVNEQSEEVPPGEVGEMWFRGPHVSKGYWNNPEATAAALDAEGWFHSGDLARRDEDGFFYIAGRQKDMIISGGVNIYPAEIEAALLRHATVADAAVVGIPDDKWGEVGVAFVVPVEGREIVESDLVVFVEQELARYKIPKRFVVIDDLPRTAYGKVVKGELRDRLIEES
jgi:fatty-acyl-CoA synthase